jgi:hypothetical protein
VGVTFFLILDVAGASSVFHAGRQKARATAKLSDCEHGSNADQAPPSHTKHEDTACAITPPPDGRVGRQANFVAASPPRIRDVAVFPDLLAVPFGRSRPIVRATSDS